MDGQMDRHVDGWMKRWIGRWVDRQTDRVPQEQQGHEDVPSHPVPTLRVQQLAEPQLLLGRVEGLLQVVGSVGLGQLVEVDEIWPAIGTQPRGAQFWGVLPPPKKKKQTNTNKTPTPRRSLKPRGQPVLVDERVEGQPVPPAGGEVLDVHLGVPAGRKGKVTPFFGGGGGPILA